MVQSAEEQCAAHAHRGILLYEDVVIRSGEVIAHDDRLRAILLDDAHEVVSRREPQRPVNGGAHAVYAVLVYLGVEAVLDEAVRLLIPFEQLALCCQYVQLVLLALCHGCAARCHETAVGAVEDRDTETVTAAHVALDAYHAIVTCAGPETPAAVLEEALDTSLVEALDVLGHADAVRLLPRWQDDDVRPLPEDYRAVAHGEHRDDSVVVHGRACRPVICRQLTVARVSDNPMVSARHPYIPRPVLYDRSQRRLEEDGRQAGKTRLLCPRTQHERKRVVDPQPRCERPYEYRLVVYAAHRAHDADTLAARCWQQRGHGERRGSGAEELHTAVESGQGHGPELVASHTDIRRVCLAGDDVHAFQYVSGGHLAGEKAESAVRGDSPYRVCRTVEEYVVDPLGAISLKAPLADSTRMADVCQQREPRIPAASPQTATVVKAERVDIGVRDGILLYASRRRCEAEETLVPCAEIQVAGLVLSDGLDVHLPAAAPYALFRRDCRFAADNIPETVGLAVIAQQTAVRPGIDTATARGEERVDNLVVSMGETVVAALTADEAHTRHTVVCAYPQMTIMVGGEALDIVVGKEVRSVETVAVVAVLISVIAVKAGACAYPQVTFRVECHALDSV